MRRAVIAVMVLALSLSLAAAAQAAAFPPKTACIETYYGDLADVSIKSVASLKDAYGTTKVYQINGCYNYYDYFGYTYGYYFPFPITGTGYAYNTAYGPVFHFSVSGTFSDDYYNYVLNIEGYADAYFGGWTNVVITAGWGLVGQWGDDFGTINCSSTYIIDYDAKTSTSAPKPRGSIAESIKARMQAGKAPQPQK